ncbi:MAG TPA: hypothetical protein VGC91_04415 [Pyrinomonadaceae bacterium]|jgi:hypothetical protein
MKFRIFRRAGFFCFLLFSLPFTTHQAEARPVRDHLTAQEADMVREAQELDKRTAVFIKAAERRLVAINDPNSAKQISKADAEKWGELKGTRADFMFDLSKILDEAITNIDDVSSRDERNPLVPKSIRKLSEAATRILAQLAPLRDTVADGKERAFYEQAVENAQQIVEAAGSLPPPPPAKSDKKKKGETR